MLSSWRCLAHLNIQQRVDMCFNHIFDCTTNANHQDVHKCPAQVSLTMLVSLPNKRCHVVFSLCALRFL
eukprot:m.108336 g.108336  ORF g.108336 m.108336 type:complete len:69 (+) comp15212_c0_seq4:2761-2967(+)